MNLSTFTALKRAMKNNEINETELKRLKQESIPLISEQIDYITNTINLKTPLDTPSVNFLVDTKTYKDELVITFLLFLAKTLNIEKLRHTFATPFSDSIYNWINLYKLVVYSVLSLMYDVKWLDKSIFALDEMIIKINEGHADALRLFMIKLNILNPKKNILHDAERNFVHNRRLQANLFGPFYWRVIHMLAEAIDTKKGCDFPKQLWRDFTVYSLHRTLRCGICEKHYRDMVQKYQKNLLNSENYSKLWFDIHNDINIKLNKQPYSEIEFEKDRKVMQKLLIQQ